MQTELVNAKAVTGHNAPPGPLQYAKEAMAELSRFLEDHPVITSLTEAKSGAAWVERTRIALKSIEDERTEKVTPLNNQLSAINGTYRAVREPLTRVYETLKARITAYNRAEEARRAAEAERLRQEAEAKEKAARDAEAAEKEAIDNANNGECTDVGSAIAEADGAFRDFQKADRTAARAERQVNVRLPSAMGGRSIAMRTVEVLTIIDWEQAITSMGVTDKIRDAILSSARDFRRQYDQLPDGVTATNERSL